jgi:predicted amidohydrolase
VKIALAQINPTVGDFTGNLAKVISAAQRAAGSGARLTVFSELVLCGYPPADLLDKPSFLARCVSVIEELCQATASLPTALLVGIALPAPAGSGKPAVNAAIFIDKGKVLLEQHKMLLPFYDVFDEQRYFAPATSQKVIEFEGGRLERQELLAPAALSQRPGRRPDAPEADHPAQHLRFALLARQARNPSAHVGHHRHAA